MNPTTNFTKIFNETIMKTKLFSFLFVLFCGVINAQFNVQEGFESGTIPAGWTTDLTDGVVTSTRSCGGTQSVRANYYVNAATSIYTSSYVSNGQAINISFYASKEIGSFFGYKYLYYEINGSGTWTQIASVYSDFSTCIPVNATISAGVIPSGATVKFRMQVNRASAANNTYVYFDNFSAVQLVPEVIAEYNFNNTYNNLLGNTPFSSNTGTSFTTDRNGNPNSALQLNSAVSVASIANLPIGNASRSVSIWVKMNGYVTNNFLFSYGSPNDNQAYGIALTPSIINNFAWANDLTSATSIPLNTWKHLVVTFDSITDLASIYLDGVLITSAVKTDWNTVNQTNFYLGGLIGYSFTFNGSVDDLKICNYALSSTEVSNLYNYNSLGVPNLPIINTISEKPAAINATLYAYVNGNGSAISNVVVKYGLTSGNLNNQVNTIAISPGANYGAIINGLAENTTYYYKVEVTNADGTTSSAVDSFTTGSKQTIAEYSFDNVYTDFSGNNAFPSNVSSSFVADRNGNPTSALNLNNNGTATAIPGLPIDGSTRTVSLWVNNANATWNYAFSYGGILTDLAFIGVVQNNSLDFYCFSNGFQATVTNPLATWMHLAYTYDGVNVRMYKNGVLVGTSPFNLFTAYDADYFYLGSSFGDMNSFNGSVDDLKIYNYPLTQTEITNLYNNNTLSTSDFNQNNLEVALYPNPVQDILSINTVNAIKSVEVYNLQGQKVLVSNQSQINLSNLSAGMYMVRIEDENNAVNTKRIIKK
jgi:hypothetical protein